MHYQYHIRSLPRDALEAYAERLLGADIVAPLKQVKEDFTAGLKHFQKEVMEARAIILAGIDALVEKGPGRSIAVGSTWQKQDYPSWPGNASPAVSPIFKNLGNRSLHGYNNATNIMSKRTGTYITRSAHQVEKLISCILGDSRW